MSDSGWRLTRLLKAGALSSRQVAFLVVLGSLSEVKSCRRPPLSVETRSLSTSVAQDIDVAVSLTRRIFCLALLTTSAANCSPKNEGGGTEDIG